MIHKEFEEEAKKCGFIATGFSKPQIPLHFNYFTRWLEHTDTGDMAYLKRHVQIRKDPERLLKGLKTVISLAYPYPASKPSTPDKYSTARYTTPHEEDYHIRLKRLGKQLCAFIGERVPGSHSRVCVDSAPIIERDFALMSGIGFMGKNNMLIIPGYGSYCFLVEILTTAEISSPQKKDIESKCGSCTKCIESCPTGALRRPYYIDVSTCLSYKTIEFKGEIDKKTADKMAKTFFGCDVCQEVCQYNNSDSLSISLPSASDILSMTESDFRRRFGKTAFKRAGLKKLQTNLMALMY